MPTQRVVSSSRTYGREYRYAVIPPLVAVITRAEEWKHVCEHPKAKPTQLEFYIELIEYYRLKMPEEVKRFETECNKVHCIISRLKQIK